MFNLLLNNKLVTVVKDDITLPKIQLHIHHTLFLDSSDYYLLQNGKRINTDTIIKPESIDIILRTCGGKGGFGSMLRAIGAQIEKTTNREACRDLSGRRLRDINEEKRLKKWIAQQSEREKEAVERRHKKLEKLCEKPKHHFHDKEYDNERTLLPEIVENAVSQGLKASCSSTTHKRKRNEPEDHKKKRKLWIDDEFDEDLLSDNSDASDNEHSSQSITSSHTSESNTPNTLKDDNILHKETEHQSNNEEDGENRSCGEDNKEIQHQSNNEEDDDNRSCGEDNKEIQDNVVSSKCLLETVV